jgi:membrane protease YdiL (CAAX protease family)
MMVSDVIATALIMVVIAGLNVADHVFGAATWLGPVVAVVLLVLSRLHGLSWAELGLARDRMPAGITYGGAAILLVVAVYAVGISLPVSRELFLDSRYHLSVGRALVVALVEIPLATVLVEEVLFRSVLWGFLARQLKAPAVLVITAVLFGAWHILPSLSLATANAGVQNVVGSGGGGRATAVVGAVALTTVGGLVFGELRRRSDSLLASIGAHWATNGVGVLFGLLARRLA